MAQIALYGFDIITGTNGGNGVRMSQIMEPGIGAANGGGKLCIPDRLSAWSTGSLTGQEMPDGRHSPMQKAIPFCCA